MPNRICGNMTHIITQLCHQLKEKALVCRYRSHTRNCNKISAYTVPEILKRTTPLINVIPKDKQSAKHRKKAYTFLIYEYENTNKKILHSKFTVMIITPLGGYILIRLCQEAEKKYKECKEKKNKK